MISRGILGTRNLVRIEENIGAVAVELTSKDFHKNMGISEHKYIISLRTQICCGIRIFCRGAKQTKRY